MLLRPELPEQPEDPPFTAHRILHQERASLYAQHTERRVQALLLLQCYIFPRRARGPGSGVLLAVAGIPFAGMGRRCQ
jgi:hypothetical protein